MYSQVQQKGRKSPNWFQILISRILMFFLWLKEICVMLCAFAYTFEWILLKIFFSFETCAQDWQLCFYFSHLPNTYFRNITPATFSWFRIDDDYMKANKEIFKFYYVTMGVVSKKKRFILLCQDHVLLRMLACFIIYFLPSYLSSFPGGIWNIFVNVMFSGNCLDINSYSLHIQGWRVRKFVRGGVGLEILYCAKQITPEECVQPFPHWFLFKPAFLLVWFHGSL
jgi:hypothetical protein